MYRYANENDARVGDTSKATETISVGNRDLSLYLVNGFPSYDSTNANIITSAWWYSTDAQGRSGYDNTRGNTGLGFIQLYEYPSSSRDSISMEFSNFNAGYYQDYTLNLSGENGSSYARFSLTNTNVDDKGIFLDYNLTLTATGLQGQVTSPGVIKATNHPTSVTGSYKGIFQNTTTSPNAGYYSFDLSLDMDSWAWEQDQLGNLTYPASGHIDGSYFATFDASAVPEPATILVWFGIAVCVGLGYWRKQQSA